MERVNQLLLDAGSSICPISWQDGVLGLLDQRLLPWEEKWVYCSNYLETAQAISEMVVRGAPAIGITAAFGMVLSAMEADEKGWPLDEAMDTAARELEAARPTAVNLKWAVDQVRSFYLSETGIGIKDLENFAFNLWLQDIRANIEIGRLGGELMPAHGGILTHCNAGALATGGYGTALGVVRGAVAAGKEIIVHADETRPWLQGARLTTWELMKDGIPVVLNVDSSSGYLMSQGRVKAVVVGSDRIAANGDVANKIGTYNLAVLARHHNIPFFVAAPVSTIDPDAPNGRAIPVEERDGAEVTDIFGKRVAPAGVKVTNPVFDVTPADLVTAIITEKGVLVSPYESAISSLFS